MRPFRLSAWAVAAALGAALLSGGAAGAAEKPLDYKRVRDSIPTMRKISDRGAELSKAIHVRMDRITKTDSEEEVLKVRQELRPLLDDYLATKTEMVRVTKSVLGIRRSDLSDQEIFDKLNGTILQEIHWKDAKFKKCVHDISRALNIPIRLNHHVVQMNTVTFDFSTTRADAVLGWLCKGFDLRYVVYDGEIIVYKKITPTESRFLEYQKKHPEVELRYWQKEKASGEYEVVKKTISDDQVKSAAARWSLEELDLGLLQESLLKVHIVETASEVHNQRRIAQKSFEGMTADWEPTGDAEIDERNRVARKKLDFDLRHYLALELDGSIEMLEVLQRVLGKNLVSNEDAAALRKFLRKDVPPIEWRSKDVVTALKEFGRSVGVPVNVTGIPPNTELEIYLTLEGADVETALSFITKQEAFEFKWKYEDGVLNFEYMDIPTFE